MASAPSVPISARCKKHSNQGFDENTLFLINKDGLPLTNETWTRMWTFAESSYPEERRKLTELRTKVAENVPIPSVPTNLSMSPVPVKVQAVQNYMRNLQYNHTGTQLFDIKKYRTLSGLNDVAREMITESLPIKCLEAIILGIYLTNGMTGLERFTIGFKSKFNEQTHRHVVLGLYFDGFYGAIGMSRREELMYKPLIYKSLTALLKDFKTSYEKFWHTLKRIKCGKPIVHDPHSFETIPWKGIQILLTDKGIDEEVEKNIEKFAKVIRQQRLSFTTCSTLPAMVRTSSESVSTSRSSPKKERRSSSTGAVQIARSPTLPKRKKKDNFQVRI